MGVKHLMDKYIDWEGEYAVNISSFARDELLDAFEILTNEREERKIAVQKNGVSGRENKAIHVNGGFRKHLAMNLTAESRQSIIEGSAQGTIDLVQGLDVASISAFMLVMVKGMQDVWDLLEGDSFSRFRCSEEFKEDALIFIAPII